MDTLFIVSPNSNYANGYGGTQHVHCHVSDLPSSVNREASNSTWKAKKENKNPKTLVSRIVYSVFSKSLAWKIVASVITGRQKGPVWSCF